VRDQLTVCRFFAAKVEYEDENASRGEKKKKKRKKPPKKNSFDDDDEFDEMFEDENSRNLFIEDEDDKNSDASEASTDSTGNFMTEQAYNNNLEGSVSIVERSGKLLKLVYMELLRIIKPLENNRPNSKKSAQSPSDLENMDSPNASS